MSGREKSGKKSGRKPGTFAKGKDSRRGRGPKPGTGGRPPDEFKTHMQAITSGPEVDAYLVRCLSGDFGPKFFLQALTYATDRGYGRATQAVELTGADGAPLFKSFIGVDTDAV